MLKEIVTVFVVSKQLFPFYASDNDVMKCSGGVYAGLAGHKCIILLSARSHFIILVAVGIRVAPHPPHRSGREALPHPAPTLGINAEALIRCLSYPHEPV